MSLLQAMKQPFALNSQTSKPSLLQITLLVRLPMRKTRLARRSTRSSRASAAVLSGTAPPHTSHGLFGNSNASHFNAAKTPTTSPTAAAVIPHLTASTVLFAGSTALVAAQTFLMIALPHWHRTRQLISSPLGIFPVAIAYGVLLGWSWQPDTFSLILPGSLAEGLKGGFKPQFFPSLTGIVTLFSRVATAASLWVHILAVNLFAARTVYLDGMDNDIPTLHTLLLCLTLAPLGLLSHEATKARYS